MTAVNIGTEKIAVKSALDNYITSVENADIELYARTVANDSDMVNFGTSAGDRVVGWNTLKEVMTAQNAALSGTKISVSDVTINISPDEQFAWATLLPCGISKPQWENRLSKCRYVAHGFWRSARLAG